MIAQAIIALFGVTAVWLSQDKSEHRRKYACLFGLASQPAWFYAAWEAQQWGIFALCFLYAFCWLKGFRQYWMDGRGIRFKPKQEAVTMVRYPWKRDATHDDLAANIPAQSVIPAETPLVRLRPKPDAAERESSRELVEEMERTWRQYVQPSEKLSQRAGIFMKHGHRLVPQGRQDE